MPSSLIPNCRSHCTPQFQENIFQVQKDLRSQIKIKVQAFRVKEERQKGNIELQVWKKKKVAELITCSFGPLGLRRAL